jgi:parvulin-like peptidyl-prolyl isomerase
MTHFASAFSVASPPVFSSATSVVLSKSTEGKQKGKASRVRAWSALLLLSLATGCSGRSIKVDNPVFAEAPPRRSLVNQSADVEEQKLAMSRDASTLQQVGHSKLSSGPLTGNSVVADVNGKPIFVDDVMGGARQVIERDPSLPDEQRQMLIEQFLRKRLPKYIEDELIVQALEKKIPEDKRKQIRDSLEPEFQKVVNTIKEKEGFVTDQQLNDRLASEGISVNQLRDSFVRMQMVEGYISSMYKLPTSIDREELLRHYQEHIKDYTPDEEVRFAEIVVRFSQHGGREGAEKSMTAVVQQLESGLEFGDVARAMSDNLSAEKRGEIGWIKRGSLLDKELEAMLFDMPAGSLSRVQVRDDRFELYKVIAHRNPGTTPFQEVQKEIEQSLLEKRKETERARVRKELQSKGHVVTIFGDSLPLRPPE